MSHTALTTDAIKDLKIGVQRPGCFGEPKDRGETTTEASLQRDLRSPFH